MFQKVEGVVSVVSGYSGGHIDKPTYKQVTNGNTGHAEVIQIFYDPKKVTFEELLEIFWKTHDPTTMNQQGNDIGPQYRSVIYYHDEEQKLLAEKYKKELDAAELFPRPIVTEIAPFTKFYQAEDYHQNYFNQNGSQPYCAYVIQPKVDKFKKVFGHKMVQ
ncbi:MAG: peptide-methionine (S)-S-oxide reductase MsrA [Bacteroidota bacterium]|nr:peptide-methionine (S)-S-oxide reductase MsrA [Bacteroidota bacterium]